MQFNKVVSISTVTLSCVLYKINHNTNNTNTSTNDVHTHHIIQNPHTPTVLQPCTHITQSLETTHVPRQKFAWGQFIWMRYA